MRKVNAIIETASDGNYSIYMDDNDMPCLFYTSDPDTVLVDLGLDVTVSRAAHSKADRAARAVARQTNDADAVFTKKRKVSLPRSSYSLFKLNRSC